MKFAIRLIISYIFNVTLVLASPYVILISFDGFRWDYLNRGLTPNLVSFASKGVRAISLEPSFPSGTFPNHYSIVTGLYPENHGIIGNHIFNPFYKTVFSLRDSNAVTDPRWYQGEAIWETARRQGILTASFFWPGSELKLEYRRPDYFVPFNSKIPYKKRIDSVIQWLKLPYENRPKFVTIYFEETDNKGHDFGPNSPQVDSAIKLCDNLFGYFLEKLKNIQLLDSVNIIVVSDHGMTQINPNQIINLSKFLQVGEINANSYGYLVSISGNKDSISKVYSILKQKEDNFKVYRRNDLPKNLNFSQNPLIGEIVVLPDFGWIVAIDSSEYTYKVKATHGFDNHWLDMHGVFIAGGPAFKQNYTTGTLRNIDIYPLICKILNIVPRQNIDGKIESIEYILK